MLKIYNLFVILSITVHLISQDVEISALTDSCINPEFENQLCYKIINNSDEVICIQCVGLMYYVDLFDSKGDHPKRVKRIELFEESIPEVIFIKAKDSFKFCFSTHFFEQFEYNNIETYYYYPTYFNPLRKKINGIRPLRGPISIKPLEFKICNCKD